MQSPNECHTEIDRENEREREKIIVRGNAIECDRERERE